MAKFKLGDVVEDWDGNIYTVVKLWHQCVGVIEGLKQEHPPHSKIPKGFVSIIREHTHIFQNKQLTILQHLKNK